MVFSLIYTPNSCIMGYLVHSISATSHHRDGFQKMGNLYFKQTSPLNDNYITTAMEGVNNRLPKFLSGSVTDLIDVVHLFVDKESASHFFYICTLLFDKYTGKRIFKHEHIEPYDYLTCVGNINNSANITRKIIIKANA